MTDVPPADAPPPEGDAPPPAGDAPDAPPPADSAPPEPGGWLDSLDPEGQGYVRGLRDEAAENRVKYRELEQSFTPYKEVFGDVDEGTRDAVLGMARTLISDPEDAGPKELLRVAKYLTGDKFDDVLKALDEPEYLTPEQMEARLEAREREKDEERKRKEAIASVEKQAADLGYPEDGPDRSMLYFYATNETDGDLEKAHEKVLAWKQAVIDGHVAEVKSVNDGYPPQSSGAGTPPAESATKPKTLAEARAAAEARLERAFTEN